MKPAVSVIYVNYNTSGLLLQSIHSLLSCCREVAFEIIIIDNASSAGDQLQLSAGLDELRHDNIRLIHSKSNTGFSKGNNQGAKHATGQYLFFLNPDTLILNDVIKIFYTFLESSGPKTAACGGNLLTEDQEPNYSYGNFPGLLYEICSIGFGLRYLFNDYYEKKVFIGRKVEGNEIIEAPYITGADIFIRTETFRLLNGFDETYFMYYEETDLFMRLQKQGYKSYILPSARIIHFEGGSTGQCSQQTFNYSKLDMTMRSKFYYFSKWFPAYHLPLKMIVFMQLMVQYLKGKQGASFKKLWSIYRRNISFPAEPALIRK